MFIKKGKETTIKEIIERNHKISADEFTKEVRHPYIKNLKEAVDFVNDNINLPITIVGDYDVDGVTSTSILYWALKAKKVTPKTRIPKRFTEGYGLNEKIIDEIDSGLVITVDNGIAANNSIVKAKEKGLKVVILDHHLPKEDENGNLILPPADIIVDPHIENESEFSDYCGAGLSYEFAKLLLPNMKLNEFLVLAALGTVCDVMPLVGANRTIVKEGLKYLNNNVCLPGLKSLVFSMKLPEGHVTEEDFGFSIGPVCNASGRLYDDGASQIVKLFTEKRNDLFTNDLILINNTRKAKVNDALKIAHKTLGENPKKPIVCYIPNIGEGIIGIIAGKLTEEYLSPSIVFTDADNINNLKGSGRSIPEVHLKKALDSIKDNILFYGGHAGAAGLTIKRDNLEAFTNAFSLACGKIPDKPTDVYYDLELDFNNLSEELTELNFYAPYGEGNPKILYHLEYDIDPDNYRVIGDGSHFMINDGDFTISAFGLTEKYESLGSPRHINGIGYLSEKWWNDNMKYQFQLIDFE